MNYSESLMLLAKEGWVPIRDADASCGVVWEKMYHVRFPWILENEMVTRKVVKVTGRINCAYTPNGCCTYAEPRPESDVDKWWLEVKCKDYDGFSDRKCLSSAIRAADAFLDSIKDSLISRMWQCIDSMNIKIAEGSKGDEEECSTGQ